MKIKHSCTLAVAVVTAISLTTTAWADTTQDTYLGKLEYQDQTITKQTADFLHRQLLLQRATQLVGWAMPMMNFYQLYPALNSKLGVRGDEPVFGLYDGYDGVYPFMTANVTTPYAIGMSDLSRTGPVVVDIPPGNIYGVVNNAWMEPTKEVNSGKQETLLLVGPGQAYPEDFKGEVVQSDTFMVLYFYRVLEAKRRTGSRPMKGSPSLST